MPNSREPAIGTNGNKSCPGCGALFPASDGPTHAYIGASAGCWAVFGEVVAREYNDFRYGAIHQMTVDTYAVQHPGAPSRRARQSVALHLISLYLQLEQAYNPEQARDALKKAADSGKEYTWLEPPARIGEITILDVYEAQTPEEHRRLVDQWARSVWKSWSLHRDTIRAWAGT
jgi:hypothetical protein